MLARESHELLGVFRVHGPKDTRNRKVRRAVPYVVDYPSELWSENGEVHGLGAERVGIPQVQSVLHTLSGIGFVSVIQKILVA